MSVLQSKLWITFGMLLVCLPGVWAQPQNQDQGQSQSQSQSQNQSQPQDQSQAPIPAYHSPLGTTTDKGNASSGTDLTPDTKPLAGAENLSLGLSESHSYWEPTVSVISTAESNGLVGSPGWTSYSTLLGGLNLHHISGRSDLALKYQGGGEVSNDGNIPNAMIQELGVVEQLSFRRETLTFIDRTIYLPESAFGYAGVGLGVGLQPGLTPNGTVLTSRVRQLDNSSLAQLDTRLSPRSSVTLLGGYSLLHFFGSNLLNTNTTIVQAGYNRHLSPKNSIAIVDRFRAFRFTGSNQSINDDLVHLSFARRVTGRMAFQVGAGPEYATFGTPIVSGSGSQTATESTRFSWSLSSNLTYALQRAQLGLSYTHGISGGGGVFAGSTGDTLRGTLSRTLSRSFTTALAFGYARNSVLAIPGVFTPGQAYNNWFGIATVSHHWGRAANVSLSYEGRYQDSNFAFCAGPTCGRSLFINEVFVTIHWQGGPKTF